MCLQAKIHKTRLEKWRTGTWFLHYDNAPARTALLIREFLANKKIPYVLTNSLFFSTFPKSQTQFNSIIQ